jgi:hypothetical protein
MKYIKTFEMYTDEHMKNLEDNYGLEFVQIMKNTAAYKKYITAQQKPKKHITVENITKEDISEIMGDEYDYVDLRDVDKEESVNFVYDLFMDIRKANPLILYRMLAVESEAHINKENVGRHYVMDKIMIDNDLIMSAGIGDNQENDADMLEYYILKVIAKKEDIDINFTVQTNTGYNEAEVTLKEGAKVEIIEIEKLEM